MDSRRLESQGSALRRSGYPKEVIHYRLSAFFHYDPAEEQTAVRCGRCRVPERGKIVLRI